MASSASTRCLGLCCRGWDGALTTALLGEALLLEPLAFSFWDLMRERRPLQRATFLKSCALGKYVRAAMLSLARSRPSTARPLLRLTIDMMFFEVCADTDGQRMCTRSLDKYLDTICGCS